MSLPGPVALTAVIKIRKLEDFDSLKVPNLKSLPVNNLLPGWALSRGTLIYIV